jgi:hypothetical protein
MFTISNRHYLSAGGVSIGVLISSGALPSLAASQTGGLQGPADGAQYLWQYDENHQRNGGKLDQLCA